MILNKIDNDFTIWFSDDENRNGEIFNDDNQWYVSESGVIHNNNIYTPLSSYEDCIKLINEWLTIN